MASSQLAPSRPATPSTASAPPQQRAPYEAPRLETHGAWSALTLQQSIPIGVGLLPRDAEATAWPV
ncbi:MAG TPA: hypothetical protein VIQ74_04090 [Gemmatimonadaceae bacterium]